MLRVIKAASLCALVAMSACSASPSTPGSEQSSSLTSSATASDGTTFSGPYATDFATAYDAATTDLEKRVLKDGSITTAEMNALHDASITCMKQAGLTKAGYDGQSLWHDITALGEQKSTHIAMECEEKQIGSIQLLYNNITQRPNNEPYAASMADCLVRLKLAPQGYSGEDFTRDSENDSLPFDPDSDAFGRCVDDPLHGGQ